MFSKERFSVLSLPKLLLVAAVGYGGVVSADSTAVYDSFAQFEDKGAQSAHKMMEASKWPDVAADKREEGAKCAPSDVPNGKGARCEENVASVDKQANGRGVQGVKNPNCAMAAVDISDPNATPEIEHIVLEACQ